jgi:RimJ/RimL family protein N-acetyltransferase
VSGADIVPPVPIETPRLLLRPWRDDDRDAFAALHADPAVMVDHVAPIDRRASDAKFDRYAAAYDAVGYCRWCLESREGAFLGCVGVMPSPPGHPLGPHAEVGWRLARAAWGLGYATEAARASLDDVFTRCDMSEVLAYTAPDNLRSQAVMSRLELRRDAARDFSTPDGPRIWQGLTWVATGAATKTPQRQRTNRLGSSG